MLFISNFVYVCMFTSPVTPRTQADDKSTVVTVRYTRYHSKGTERTRLNILATMQVEKINQKIKALA